MLETLENVALLNLNVADDAPAEVLVLNLHLSPGELPLDPEVPDEPDEPEVPDEP